MDAIQEVPDDPGVRASASTRVPSKHLDQEGVLFEKLRRLKKERSGYLSAVTSKRNEIDALLLYEENIQLVKEKMPGFLAAFEAFKEAHVTYLSNLQDETSVTRCQEQFVYESSQADNFCQKVREWIRSVELSLSLNSEINPEDSASQIASRTYSKSSARQSRRSNRSGSQRSSTSSLTVVRAKEIARIAELKAEAAAFKKRQ
ncbi:hypothetical protein ACROYT_G025196, partial [Oculina patagonica]